MGNEDSQLKDHKEHTDKVYNPVYSLLGDIGGTNMRLQLVLIQPPHSESLQVVKKDKLLVKDHGNFQAAIAHFLEGIPAQKYPKVAAIAVAGPVEDNKVYFSNVLKWGQIDGNKLGANLKIGHFIFLNDFIANSFGLLTFPEDNFISLNGLQPNQKHLRGVLGPGTGLGNSVIFSAPFRNRHRIYVLPSEGGHTDAYYLGDEKAQYYKFVTEKIKHPHLGVEYALCGPAIPYMYQFLANKYPTFEGADKKPTSQQIFTSYLAKPDAETLERKTVEFFIQIYSASICNFAIHHMTTGGVYLVGSLTTSILETLKKIDLIEHFSKRHPEIAPVLKKIPIIVSKEVDLGLKGAYFYARRAIADQQHD